MKILQQWTDQLWHRRLGRPYRLHKSIDKGRGAPVVMLHGLGRSGHTWDELTRRLKGQSCRRIAFDLLGFGKSPKPEWLDYTVEDHAAAVIASLSRLRLKQPVILVGHSMGCLVSVEIARQRPDLVRHMILYEMPLYAGLPDTRGYRLRLNFYRSVYKRIIAYQPVFNDKNVRFGQRMAERLMGFKVYKPVWPAFVKSLEHTIMAQHTAEDLKHIKTPIDIIYGKKDRLVIRGKTKLLFGDDVKHVTAHIIREKHRITPRSSRFLAKRIVVALQNQTKQEIRSQEPAEPAPLVVSAALPTEAEANASP